MENEISKFPKDFLWGAATASHQVEGNTDNQWSDWEKKNAERLAQEAKSKWSKWQQEKFPEMFKEENYISGRACDHYNRYEADFDLAKEGAHNAHRFSIEWSRIEPEEGKFDKSGIEHYRKVLAALCERNLQPFITLWHWTNPLWLEKEGGCSSKKFVLYFSRYAKYVVENLGDNGYFWITLNEPTAVISMAYAKGAWPPQKKNIFSALRVFNNLAQAHSLAYDLIHQVLNQAKVSFSHNMFYYEPNNPKSMLDRLVVRIAEYFGNQRFFNMIKGKKDFLCLQYYFHARLKFPGIVKNENKQINDLGWEIYPEGIYHILNNLKKYNLPIYITENGIADAQDEKRTQFIKDHLFWIKKSIEEGVEVRGYFYWSLMDNFEWDKGFWPRFGLIEVDYKTIERKPRKSFYAYKEIIKNNGI
jgi:beta-glucosidase